MNYRGHYWTGHGYRGIDEHTIKFYPISVNAKDDEEAINKIIKKAGRVAQYNECYHWNKKIPITVGNKVGLLFLKEKVINWGEGRIYWGIGAFSVKDLSRKYIKDYYYRDGQDYHSFILNKYYHSRDIESIYDFKGILIKSVFPSVDAVINDLIDHYPEYAYKLK